MAGSYHHIMNGDHTPGSITLIENMGDASECIQELLFLVRALGTDEEIDEALKVFYQHERGESPDRFTEAYADCTAIFRDL